MQAAPRSFDTIEIEQGGTVRLALRGELDIAAVGELQERLEALAARGAAVELDLGELEFIDSTGIACITQAVRRAREQGQPLTVGRQLQVQVQRLLELVDGESLFWPTA